MPSSITQRQSTAEVSPNPSRSMSFGTGRGGTWNSANVIVFAGVSDSALFTRVGSMEGSPVFAAAIGSAEPQRSWLVYGRDGVLAAQPFDPRARTISGDAVSLADEPTVGGSWAGSPATSVSASGALAYFSESSPNKVAQWLDASGRPTGSLKLEPQPYAQITISPDGRRAILGRETSLEDTTLWLADLERMRRDAGATASVQCRQTSTGWPTCLQQPVGRNSTSSRSPCPAPSCR